MEWKGKNLENLGEVLDASVQCSSPEEARAFLALWEIENPHAKDNLGYMIGYLPDASQDRMNEWFGVQHPVWGRRHPTTDEILVKGLLAGLKVRYPAHTELPVVERIVWRIIEESAKVVLDARKLLLEQLLQACYLVTRSLGGKDKHLPQMGEQKTREFVDMVLFVRKLIGNEEPMFTEPERKPEDEQEYS